ncbi:hypothetical protein L7F22_045391 [Adiantum nelumboides]|nr:hypothetical protein [Adiantum nelumboides]
MPFIGQASTRVNQDDLGTVGSKVEILSQDSALTGCWFRCTVMERVESCVKVSYDDLKLDDDGGKLEEWMSMDRTTAADQLGFRLQKRRILRPSPLEVEMLSTHYQECAVDAWEFDGWWEGILTGRDASGKVKKYCPRNKHSISLHCLSGIEPASPSLSPDHGAQGNPPNEGRQDRLPDEDSEDSPPDQANKVLTLDYEQLFIIQAFENTSEKVNNLYFNLKSASPSSLTMIQDPDISEAEGGNDGSF